MVDHLLIFIAFAFLLAGFVKGTLGLGLPTVAMGLLATTMAPGQAIAIVIVPAIVTNIWQTFVGPYLRDILRRLWPLMLGTVVGIWINAGLLTGPYAAYGTVVLGALLVIYAIVGLSRFNFKVARRHEKWVGGIVGLITGLISAATGVQVIPSVPFMQAIGMDKDELVQALGVFFTNATLALAFNLTASGLLTAATALPGAVAMMASFTGMFIGQAVRTRMQPDVFRRWFLISMILLGVFFTNATLALAFNLTASGLLTAATALPGAVAMMASFTGMFIGQAVRTRMQPDVFRRWFLISMILLGIYLAGSALLKIHG